MMKRTDTTGLLISTNAHSNNSVHSHDRHRFLTNNNGKGGMNIRHIAALDFLQHIPMSNEEKIKDTGKKRLARNSERDNPLALESISEVASSENLQATNNDEVSGKKLKGKKNVVLNATFSPM